MTTIYICESGTCCDDYSIEAAFSSEELAKRAEAAMGWNGVRELDIDDEHVLAWAPGVIPRLLHVEMWPTGKCVARCLPPGSWPPPLQNTDWTYTYNPRHAAQVRRKGDEGWTFAYADRIAWVTSKEMGQELADAHGRYMVEHLAEFIERAKAS